VLVPQPTRLGYGAPVLYRPVYLLYRATVREALDPLYLLNHDLHLGNVPLDSMFTWRSIPPPVA
jgi:hypothetical protein